MIRTLIETYEFTYKEVKIYVTVDYRNKKISLVDPFDSKYKKKEWIFAERQVEYMDGWVDILEAMKLAVKDAKTRLMQDSQIQEKKFADLIIKANKK